MLSISKTVRYYDQCLDSRLIDSYIGCKEDRCSAQLACKYFLEHKCSIILFRASVRLFKFVQLKIVNLQIVIEKKVVVQFSVPVQTYLATSYLVSTFFSKRYNLPISNTFIRNTLFLGTTFGIGLKHQTVKTEFPVLKMHLRGNKFFIFKFECFTRHFVVTVLNILVLLFVLNNL